MDQFAFADAFATEGSGPAYKRLAQAIARAIEDGRLRAGGPLPTERSLAERLGLSRVTVRSAYKALAEDGLLETRAGSGNYVRSPQRPIEQPLWRLSSFSDDIARQGRTPGARVLAQGRGPATEREREALRLGAADRVVRLQRLRLADATPLAIETAALPEGLVGDAELGSGSLYAVLERLGLRPSRAVQRLRAVLLDAGTAALLAVPPHSAGMLNERCSYLPDGRPIEYTSSFYRGDAYDFVAEMHTSGDPT